MPKRRVIRDEQARLDPATTWLYRPLHPATQPLPAQRRLLTVDPGDWLDIYEATADHLLADVPRAHRPRHALNDDRRVLMARHADFDGDGTLDHLQGDPPAESAELPAEHDYTYTDPITDPDWVHITEPDDDAPDAFPDSWSSEPTERDQAAIDAGNA